MLEKPIGAMENKESGDNGNIVEIKQNKNKQTNKKQNKKQKQKQKNKTNQTKTNRNTT